MEVKTTAKTFEANLELILGLAYGVALRLTRNPSDAEDLVQEAAVKSFCNFHTFEMGTNFKASFLRIMTNAFYKKYRKKQCEPEMVDVEDDLTLYLYNKTHDAGFHAAVENPGEVLLRKMDAARIAAAIEDLAIEYRIVAAFYFMDEFSYQEIAEIVDCPAGTVRLLLHRDRKLLQKSLWQVAEEQGIVGEKLEARGK